MFPGTQCNTSAPQAVREAAGPHWSDLLSYPVLQYHRGRRAAGEAAPPALPPGGRRRGADLALDFIMRDATHIADGVRALRLVLPDVWRARGGDGGGGGGGGAEGDATGTRGVHGESPVPPPSVAT
jgi:hypothetical protein